MQETFLRLVQARRRYRPGAPVRPWLYTIAYNLLRGDDEKERAAARRALLAAVGEAIPALKAALASETDTEVHDRFAEVLAERERLEHRVLDLLGKFDDPAYGVREEATRSLIEAGKEARGFVRERTKAALDEAGKGDRLEASDRCRKVLDALDAMDLSEGQGALYEGDDGPEKPIETVVRTDAEWEAIVGSCRAEEAKKALAAKKPDFRKEAAVVLAAGSCSVAADGFENVGVRAENGTWIVHYVRTMGGDVLLADPKYPVAIWRIPRSDAKVTFERGEREEGGG